MSEFDVLVVGGGPAGSACATWLARRGLKVGLLEKKKYPRAKTCGDGLTPRAVKQLEDLNLGHILESAHEYIGLRACGFNKTLELEWPKISGYPDTGFTITRFNLDHALANNASSEGVSLLTNTEVTDVVGDVSEINCLKILNRNTNEVSEIKALTYVIAEGSNSRIMRRLGASRNRSYPTGIAIRGYIESSRSKEDWIESHLDIRDSEGKTVPGYGWIFPLGDGTINIGAGLLSTSKRWKGFNSNVLFESFFKMVQYDWDLASLDSVKDLKGGKLPMGLGVNPFCGKNWIAVGDAAGSVNPFNGEGISYALETGRIGAEVISSSISTEYSNEINLQLYSDLIEESYRSYYRLGKYFVDFISIPQLLSLSLQLGMSSKTLMQGVLKIMANLPDHENKRILERSMSFLEAVSVLVEKSSNYLKKSRLNS